MTASTSKGEDVTKQFHICDVLSVTTGILVSPRGMDGVYEILNWMTGESLYTHQLPRVCRKATPVLLAAYPELENAQGEAEMVTPANIDSFIAKMVAYYGETIAVPKLNADQHERIDP